MKHKAIVIGAGRIGSEFEWIETPFVYSHARAYLALKERVELIGFVEPDGERAAAAEKKWRLPVWKSLIDVDPTTFDVASVCTQPDSQLAIMETLIGTGVRAVWCEKPCQWRSSSIVVGGRPVPIQVNYIRRFEPTHQHIREILASGKYGKIISLTVSAKKDVHTVCHFTNLARWWGVPKERFHYVDTLGTAYTNCDYELILEKRKFSFIDGGCYIQESGYGKGSRWWPDMLLPAGITHKAWNPTFMTNAVDNLLDAVEGKAHLMSPPDLEAEAWAEEILR